MSKLSNRLPHNQTYEETLKFLTWEQFPAILNKSIEYFAVLPQVGTYQHFNAGVKDFREALLDTTTRQFTLSGVGSMIDYDKFGHTIKRPTPQLAGTGCEGNTLCLEPNCFGFTEGVIESNNILQNMCWSLSLPCLKDILYSDAQFERKLKAYFRMFFMQAPAVMQAYQRTRLIAESIKVIATDQNIRFTGSQIGGQDGISLPFYIDPNDATAMPCVDNLPAGTNIGGANLSAFMRFLAPRLFQGAFSGGEETVKVYGLKHDYNIAKEQTASVQDHSLDLQQLAAIRALGGQLSGSEELLGDFRHDGLFPTFKLDADNCLEPVVAETLEPSTIAGYQQVGNPEHMLAQYRGLLLVPSNWKFDLVEPPRDDFSSLGLGEGLNFRNNTPGVHPIMSSSMFTGNTVGEDGTVILGNQVDARGIVQPMARGLRARDRSIKEAIRTEVVQTYSTTSCANATEGQLPAVGRGVVPQGRADGFMLKSTAYFGTDVKGQARPVLILFKVDTPRSARPIEVCSVSEVDVSAESGVNLVDCCPGNQAYAVLTFNKDVSALYTVGDQVVYRSGRRGDSYLARVTAVAGAVVTVQAILADGNDDPTAQIPCCEGSQNDDYGVMGELLINAGATVTATQSEIMKVQYDDGSTSLFLELFTPVAATTAPAAATITLENGDTILVETVADAEGVFVQVVAAAAETSSLADIDCNCLVNAVISFS